MNQERELIEKAIKDGAAIANWPPSRGPKPPDEERRSLRWRKPTIVMYDNRAERVSLPKFGVAKGPMYEYGLSAHVQTIGRLSAHVAGSVLSGARDSYAGSLLPGEEITVDITYPLSHTARVTVHPYQIVRRPTGEHGGKERVGEHRHQSIGYFLWQIARVYRRIYKDHERWGVWGHGLGDLWFEHIKVRDGVAILSIGS